jgi:hypothetical protein
MIKKILILFLLNTALFSHPVSYTIDLTATYDENKKEALIVCKSDNRNKCGLYGINLNDKDDNTLAKARYPFMKKNAKVKVDQKPNKLVFYLRSMPEHNYIVYFK